MNEDSVRVDKRKERVTGCLQLVNKRVERDVLVCHAFLLLFFPFLVDTRILFSLSHCKGLGKHAGVIVGAPHPSRVWVIRVCECSHAFIGL
jgi:hypothetical protein